MTSSSLQCLGAKCPANFKFQPNKTMSSTLTGSLQNQVKGNVTTLEILSSLRNKGIKLWADGDQLRYSAPAGITASDFFPLLKERKMEILQFLLEVNNTARAVVPIIKPIPRDKLKGVPLSFAQERLWFLDQ